MPGPRFRALVYLTLLPSFLVVVWGGVVRVSGSGLGCPDWPTCHGQFLPSLDPATQIEWFHRFLGVAGGLTLAALGVTTLVTYRTDRRILALVIAAGVLYIFQAVIGAVVVILELPETWVTAHLANAEVLLAVLTVLAVGVRWPEALAARERSAPWTSLLLAGAVGTYVLMLTGAYVRGDDATTACSTWPLCDEGSLPVFGAAAVHMAHRWVAAIVGVVVVAWHPSAPSREFVSDLVTLTKPAIMSLLLLTPLGGMFRAARGIPSCGLLAATLIGG